MCVVLSSGLRRNSYTPAGRVREVLLGATVKYMGLSQAFDRALCAELKKGPRIQFNFYYIV